MLGSALTMFIGTQSKLAVTQGGGLRKLMSPQVPNHEILGLQHISLNG